MLWLTAFLFPVVAFNALDAGETFQAIAWTVLYGTSTCLHSNPVLFDTGHPITILDKSLGKAITLGAAISVAQLPLNALTLGVWSAIAYVPIVYYIKLAHLPRYDPKKWYPWHTSMHVVAMAGMHMLFAARRLNAF